jgi:hypothetical protein
VSVLRETNGTRRTYGNPRPLHLHGSDLQTDLREAPAQQSNFLTVLDPSGPPDYALATVRPVRPGSLDPRACGAGE